MTFGYMSPDTTDRNFSREITKILRLRRVGSLHFMQQDYELYHLLLSTNTCHIVADE